LEGDVKMKSARFWKASLNNAFGPALAIGFSASALTIGGFFVSGVSSLTGCVLPTASDAGASPIPTGDSGTIGSSASGTGCGTDTTTGVTLCVGTSACPSVAVDPSVFPECGFYFTGGAAFLACVCSNYLCPIGSGAVSSCSEAASILAASNEGSVCGEASNGGCTAVTGTNPTDGGGTGPTNDSSCTEGCMSMCNGVPDCLQQCGC
jgi:hypothetical protein